MHIGICDDEIAELQSLKRMIESYCDAHGLEAEIHLFASGVELLSESEHLEFAVFGYRDARSGRH